MEDSDIRSSVFGSKPNNEYFVYKATEKSERSPSKSSKHGNKKPKCPDYRLSTSQVDIYSSKKSNPKKQSKDSLREMKTKKRDYSEEDTKSRQLKKEKKDRNKTCEPTKSEVKESNSEEKSAIHKKLKECTTACERMIMDKKKKNADKKGDKKGKKGKTKSDKSDEDSCKEKDSSKKGKKATKSKSKSKKESEDFEECIDKDGKITKQPKKESKKDNKDDCDSSDDDNKKKKKDKKSKNTINDCEEYEECIDQDGKISKQLKKEPTESKKDSDENKNVDSKKENEDDCDFSDDDKKKNKKDKKDKNAKKAKNKTIEDCEEFEECIDKDGKISRQLKKEPTDIKKDSDENKNVHSKKEDEDDCDSSDEDDKKKKKDKKNKQQKKKKSKKDNKDSEECDKDEKMSSSDEKKKKKKKDSKESKSGKKGKARGKSGDKNVSRDDMVKCCEKIFSEIKNEELAEKKRIEGLPKCGGSNSDTDNQNKAESGSEGKPGNQPKGSDSDSNSKSHRHYKHDKEENKLEKSSHNFSDAKSCEEDFMSDKGEKAKHRNQDNSHSVAKKSRKANREDDKCDEYNFPSNIFPNTISKSRKLGYREQTSNKNRDSYSKKYLLAEVCKDEADYDERSYHSIRSREWSPRNETIKSRTNVKGKYKKGSYDLGNKDICMSREILHYRGLEKAKSKSITFDRATWKSYIERNKQKYPAKKSYEDFSASSGQDEDNYKKQVLCTAYSTSDVVTRSENNIFKSNTGNDDKVGQTHKYKYKDFKEYALKKYYNS